MTKTSIIWCICPRESFSMLPWGIQDTYPQPHLQNEACSSMMGHYTKGMYVSCTTLTKYLCLWIFYAWCLERIMVQYSTSYVSGMIMVLSTGKKIFTLMRIKRGWSRGFKGCMQEGTGRRWMIATEIAAGTASDWNTSPDTSPHLLLLEYTPSSSALVWTFPE